MRPLRLLNAMAQVGTALGLAVLIPLSAARTEVLSGVANEPADAALVAGYAWGFVGAVAFAIVGTLAVLVLVRGEAAGGDLQTPPADQPSG